MRTIILFLLTLFLLSGCTYETTIYEDDPMNDRARDTPEQWGQEKVFEPGSWKPGQVRSVLTRDTPRIFTKPQTSTMVMGLVNEDSDASQLYILRWVLRAGTGGARTEVRFDATRYTRIALPLEAFSLGLSLDDFGSGDQPVDAVQAFAFVGEGGLGTNDPQGATFSVPVTLNGSGALQQIIPLPVGACGVRVVGQEPTGGGADSPFIATTFLLLTRGNNLVGSLQGVGAAPSDPSLFTLFASGKYLPLPASITAVVVQATDNVDCTVEFKLDL